MDANRTNDKRMIKDWSLFALLFAFIRGLIGVYSRKLIFNREYTRMGRMDANKKDWWLFAVYMIGLTQGSSEQPENITAGVSNRTINHVSPDKSSAEFLERLV